MSFGITHPSLSNYLALFSGSTQGVANDSCSNGPFHAPNLYTRMDRAGLRINHSSANGGPAVPWIPGCAYDHYLKRHNPCPFFTGVPGWTWIVNNGHLQRCQTSPMSFQTTCTTCTMARRSPSKYGGAIGGCPETCRSSLIMPTRITD